MEKQKNKIMKTCKKGREVNVKYWNLLKLIASSVDLFCNLIQFQVCYKHKRMFAVSTVKPLCFSEPTLRLQQKFYSRTTSSQNLKFFFDSFRKNINSTFINKFYPKFEPFKYSASFKDHSTRIFRLSTKQCEFIFAHRLRRSQQIFSLYKKLWGDFRLLWFIPKFNANALKHRKLFYSATLSTGFAWEKKRISEDELLR